MLRDSFSVTVTARAWSALVVLLACLGLAHAEAWGAPASYTQTVLADAPSAYLRLDDAGSTVADSSGHGHTGTVPSGATHTLAGALVGDANRALHVDDDHGLTVASGGLPGLDASQTVEEWVQLDPNLHDGVTHRLIGLNDVGLDFSGSQDGSSDYLNLVAPHGGSIASVSWSTTDSPSLADGNWHQLAYTFDATAKRVAVYLDGAAVAGFTTFGALGGNPGTPLSTDFTGNLDELAVYPTALTPTRIAAHYTAAQGP